MAIKRFLTFGGGSQKYRDAALRLGREAQNTHLFDEILALTDYDLLLPEHADFMEKFGKFIESHPRGFGLLLWKPYLISLSLATLEDGDILVFADSGCEFGQINQLKKVFSELEKKYHKSLAFNRAGVYGYGNHAIKPFCSSLVLNKFDPEGEIEKEFMFEAGDIAIKVCDVTREFIDEWFLICADTENLVDPPRETEPPGFIDHRHDQALFSILMRKKYPVLLNGDMSDVLSLGIVPKRKRHGRLNNYFQCFAEGVFLPIPYEKFEDIHYSTVMAAHFDPSDRGENLVTYNRGKNEYNFHTEAEKNPFVLFKFRKEMGLSVIIVENREHSSQRLKNLKVETLLDDGTFQAIYEFSYTFGGFYDESPLVLNMPYGFRSSQIKISTMNDSEDYFHLKSVYFYS